MPITKTQAQAVSAEIIEAATAILARHGLAAPKGRTTYGDELRITITASAVELNEAGINTASPEAIAYERYAFSYGLKPGLLGAQLTIRGANYTFIGIAAKRPKYPLAFRTDAGKTMLYTTDLVTRLNATLPAVPAPSGPTLTEVDFPSGAK